MESEDKYLKTWTDEEIRLLKDKYCISTNEELKKLFPDRTELSIYKKAYSLGFRKEKEIAFQNRSLSKKGEKSSNWNGGRKKTNKGYILLLMPEHDRADSSGYVFEHIVVFENHTGIKVPRNCCIHHLNGNKSDNRIENLCMMSFGGHTIFHNKNKPMSEETKKKISESKRKKHE